MQINQPLLTADDLAELLGISTEAVYDMNAAGTGPQVIKVGQRVRYDPDDVSSWLAAQRVA